MTKSSIEMVKEFMEKYGQLVRDKPFLVNEKLNKFRLDLMKEECFIELQEALAEHRLDPCSRTKAKVLDSLCDAQYVLDGAFLALGFWKVKDQAIAEVHRSNMSKNGGVRDDGKILKGEGFSPPDLEQFI